MTRVNRVAESRFKAKENYYNFDFETSTPKSLNEGDEDIKVLSCQKAQI